MKNLLLLFFIVIGGFVFAQNPTAYKLVDGEGNPVEWGTMMKDLSGADIVFFGELHNNAIAHWLQFELTKDLFDKHNLNLILGAEMFESDNQLIIDEYLEGKIRTKDFENEARLWDNYKTDYKPLLEFAKYNKLKFIASNIPRRYAAMVNTQDFIGLDSLSDEAKKYFAPLPITFDPTVSCYAEMMQMGGHMPGKMKNPMNLAKAQAAKDATMAHFILQNWNKGKVFLHFNGRYHSDNHEGIAWYIEKYKPGLNIIVISTVTSSDLDSLPEDEKGAADYFILVDEDVTLTY